MLKIKEEEYFKIINMLKTITENLNNITDIENITDGEYTYNSIFDFIKNVKIEEVSNE